ncbi:DUF6114 domain-containing protein [Actinoplanes oblitus]|uniref:DUF6114 domain-containing protein n=1 Tax=Actinoplanes oblitus TaxID=3040509 RepID=A0ABY8WCU6_9ACTN|nr:DUF6114 domain-containing protein [Actinoplanes oblitus]WIM94303.1 DUF6114 domain-containing protein [Actinoplanes oblitus]
MSTAGAQQASPGVRAWRGFRTWRRSRPFWGGLLVLLGGVEILMTVWAPLGVVLHVGMQNFIGYLLPLVIILLGVLLIFNPAQRLFYSLIAIVCALASFLTSNMGGFLIGLLLTLVGGALAFAWAPIGAAPAVPQGAAPADIPPGAGSAPRAVAGSGPSPVPPGWSPGPPGYPSAPPGSSAVSPGSPPAPRWPHAEQQVDPQQPFPAPPGSSPAPGWPRAEPQAGAEQPVPPAPGWPHAEQQADPQQPSPPLPGSDQRSAAPRGNPAP